MYNVSRYGITGLKILVSHNLKLLPQIPIKNRCLFNNVRSSPHNKECRPSAEALSITYRSLAKCPGIQEKG